MLTAAQSFTDERGHFHARCALCSCAWCHVMSWCRAVCRGQLQVKDIQFPHIIWWFFIYFILKRGFLNRLCGFHLVIERNGYFVYFSFVVQTFCNKNTMKHTELYEWAHLLENVFHFLLSGTENVKQNHIFLNWNPTEMQTADEE